MHTVCMCILHVCEYFKVCVQVCMVCDAHSPVCTGVYGQGIRVVPVFVFGADSVYQLLQEVHPGPSHQVLSKRAPDIKVVSPVQYWMVHV